MRKIILSLAILLASVIPAVPALAVNVYQPVCVAGGAQSASPVCQSTDTDPLTTKDGVLHRVTSIVATIAGVAAVIVIIIAGIVYITSGGEAEKTKKAKRAIIYAAIGLVVIVLGQAIIGFVIGGIT